MSKNVKFKFPGRNLIAPYMSDPINNADTVVPMIANVKIAPKFRKKYFYNRNIQRLNWKFRLKEDICLLKFTRFKEYPA